MQTVGNIDIFVLTKYENKLEILISNINFNSVPLTNLNLY